MFYHVLSLGNSVRMDEFEYAFYAAFKAHFKQHITVEASQEISGARKSRA